MFTVRQRGTIYQFIFGVTILQLLEFATVTSENNLTNTKDEQTFDMFGKHNNKQAPFLQTAKMRSKKNLLEFVFATASHAPPK